MRPTVAPLPAQSPRGQDLGDQIRQSVQQAVSGAMAPVRAEMRARLDELRSERSALRDNLDAAQSAPARRDLTRQVQELDVEIAKLQKGLNELDAKFTADAPRTFATTSPPSPLPPMDPANSFNPGPMIISIMAILFIGFPLAVTFARIMWRRASGAAVPTAAVTAETGRRFDRLEQSVDAIAIEIERISENQRYLTKVLSEPRQGASVGAGDK